jgi:sulfotransferase
MDKFIGLSGLPRSGATLLSAILDQNPEIHAEGNSAVCQLMWDMQESCYGASNTLLNAARRGHTIPSMVAAIPSAYYKDVSAPVIIDKCRSWTLPKNMEMLQKYFVRSPKVIVLERPLVDILKSFLALHRSNGKPVGQADLNKFNLSPNSEPMVRSLDGIIWAKQNNQNGNFLFIRYDDLVADTESVLTSIYDFFEIAPFKHDLNNIINNHPEDDVGVYDNLGLHYVRPTICKRKIDETLTDAIIAKCVKLEASNVLGHINGWKELLGYKGKKEK